MKTQVLKPGYLISLKTSIRGGVQYDRTEIEGEHTDANGARVSEWQTRREIPDPAEFEAATLARSKARSVITGVCCASSFGLLCPMERADDLEAAITEARALTDAHNATASRSHVDVYVLAGRIAHDAQEAARAIGSELRELMDEMSAGIANANPERIREAAGKARALGVMLDDNVSGKVSEAIAEARSAARAIVKRVEKAGETAAVVVAECQTAKIEAARFAFLDLDEGAAVTSEAPAARGLDLETEAPTVASVSVPVPQFEMGD